MAAADWLVVAAYMAAMVAIGAWLMRRGGRDTASYFAAGRSLPWWLAGTSFAATTFASDTPLFVTELVRTKGIWGNWIWWGFLISHALAAAVFARWWRRCGALTEVELAERRYSGRGAAFLRGIKAVYWGVLFNAVVMGALPLNAMKTIMKTTTGWDPQIALWASAAAVLAYGAVSGLWGVVVTDLIQFAIALAGAVVLAVFAVRAAGGWEAVVAAAGPERVAFVAPSGEAAQWMLAFLLVQWWAFKNADGGAIFAQRALACRDERHAVAATLSFLVAHYAVRVWPWVVVALASLVVLPHAPATAAYPLMATHVLPDGLRGLLVASFLAAFMSTMDTHMNWGASYAVHDLYRRFLRPAASERECVRIGRWASVLILGIALVVAAHADTLESGFQWILHLTAGVGPVLLARWLWWRVNAWSEIAAMAASPVFAAISPTDHPLWKVGWIAVCTMCVWIPVTLLTPPAERPRLREFYRAVRPFRFGWRPVAAECGGAEADRVAPALASWVCAAAMTLAFMFGLGALLFGPRGWGAVATALGALLLWRLAGRRWAVDSFRARGTVGPTQPDRLQRGVAVRALFDARRR